tara:strand:- start:6036 stop:6227 length:192 start_codon:yes stop_codon:yes gene_type:complete
MNEVINIEKTKKEKPKVYHLCSEGNRRIIQSSYYETEIDEAVIFLNHLNEDYVGIKSKFYKME